MAGFHRSGFALLVLVAFCAALPAEAYAPRARHVDDVTRYEFVAETPLDAPGGGVLSLCITFDHAPLGMGIKTQAYALAPDRCKAKRGILGLVEHEIEHLRLLNDAEVRAYKAAGVLPADLPLRPEVSLRARLRANFLWLALLLPVVGLGALRLGLRFVSRPARPRHGLADGLALALWSVANADGVADAREREIIDRQVRAAGGSDFDPACIPAACAPVNMVEIAQDFRSAARRLSAPQRSMVLRSAVSLATRNRPASDAERAVIFKLAQEFGLPSPV